jgi:succinate dehydrogenase flavin-adding protein (antitoxin of CptAB toxin-antitoxin module)
MRVVSKFVEKNAPNLSPEQKQQVARILVSEDPSLVSNALRDQSGMAMLQQKLQAIGNRVARTSGGLLTAPATTSLQNFLTQ